MHDKQRDSRGRSEEKKRERLMESILVVGGWAPARVAGDHPNQGCYPPVHGRQRKRRGRDKKRKKKKRTIPYIDCLIKVSVKIGENQEINVTLNY